jgi:hypothetical protein
MLSNIFICKLYLVNYYLDYRTNLVKYNIYIHY